jgi:hypothetical protein
VISCSLPGCVASTPGPTRWFRAVKRGRSWLASGAHRRDCGPDDIRPGAAAA